MPASHGNLKDPSESSSKDDEGGERGAAAPAAATVAAEVAAPAATAATAAAASESSSRDDEDEGGGDEGGDEGAADAAELRDLRRAAEETARKLLHPCFAQVSAKYASTTLVELKERLLRVITTDGELEHTEECHTYDSEDDDLLDDGNDGEEENADANDGSDDSHINEVLDRIRKAVVGECAAAMDGLTDGWLESYTTALSDNSAPFKLQRFPRFVRALASFCAETAPDVSDRAMRQLEELATAVFRPDSQFVRVQPASTLGEAVASNAPAEAFEPTVKVFIQHRSDLIGKILKWFALEFVPPRQCILDVLLKTVVEGIFGDESQEQETCLSDRLELFAREANIAAAARKLLRLADPATPAHGELEDAILQSMPGACFEIAGATGKHADICNGVYKKTAEMYNGKPAFQKMGDSSAWCVYISSTHRWMVTLTQYKDAHDDLGYARSVEIHLDVPGRETKWQVYSGSEWEEQPDVSTVLTLTTI